MPTCRLTSEGIPILKYDVVGMDSQSLMECIGHVGLSIEACDLLKTGDNLALRHMAPPFTVTHQPCVTVVGTAGLTANEIKAIDVFIDEVEQEYQAERVRSEGQYHIHPHVEDAKAPDGTVIYRRFSCAGFVIEAYGEAGINGVLNTDETQLPPVSLESLIMIYPDFAKLLRNPRRRGCFGLSGDGPWPVVLPGYILNSLARPEVKIRSEPYVASTDDQFFPPRFLGPK